MSIQQSSINDLSHSFGILTNHHVQEYMEAGFFVLMVLAFAPIVIAVVRRQSDHAAEILMNSLLGCLALASFIAFPAGLYLFYKNYQFALTVHVNNIAFRDWTSLFATDTSINTTGGYT